MAKFDPGRVKTPKGRSRRGIVFYRRRSFRVVLPLLARTLGWKRRPFYVFFTHQHFDTAKTLSGLSGVPTEKSTVLQRLCPIVPTSGPERLFPPTHFLGLMIRNRRLGPSLKPPVAEPPKGGLGCSGGTGEEIECKTAEWDRRLEYREIEQLGKV